MATIKSRAERKLEVESDDEYYSTDDEYDSDNDVIEGFSTEEIGKNAKELGKKSLDRIRNFEIKFKRSKIFEKITLILGTIMQSLLNIIENVFVFFIAVLSVFYLYFKFGDGVSTQDLFPSNPSKFPYVFFEKDKSIDEQLFMTTSIIDEFAGSSKPFFTSVEPSFSDGGSINTDKTMEKTNQRNNKRTDLNSIASFFHSNVKDKKNADINLIQLISYVLISGVIGVYGFFGKVHDLFRGLFIKESIDDNIILKMLCYFMTFFLIIVVYFFYKGSSHDLKDIIMAISAGGADDVAGMKTILQVLSSLFSGFFAFGKIIYVVSYIAFIFFSAIALMKILGTFESMSTVLFSYMFLLIMLVSLFVFSKATFETFQKTSNLQSVGNTLFGNIFESLKGSMKSLVDVLQNGGSAFGKMAVPKMNGNFLDMMKTMISLPIRLIGLVVGGLLGFGFLALAVISIIFVFIPIIGSIFPTLNIVKDFTVNGLFNFENMKQNIIENIYVIIIAFLIMSSVIILGSLKYLDSKNITLPLIESIVYSLFALSITIAGLMLKQKYTNTSTNDQNNGQTNN